MNFGSIEAAFGPDGTRHSNSATENIRMVYDKMYVDAPENATVAVAAADARDDEDDVVSLSSKASADPRSNSYGSEKWHRAACGRVAHARR
jgi:hypothetical protein